MRIRQEEEMIMRVPSEKYANDPEYRHLVDLLLLEVYQARFTPLELKEASVLALIIYERRQVRRLPKEIENRLEQIHSWLDEIR